MLAKGSEDYACGWLGRGSWGGGGMERRPVVTGWLVSATMTFWREIFCGITFHDNSGDYPVCR